MNGLLFDPTLIQLGALFCVLGLGLGISILLFVAALVKFIRDYLRNSKRRY